MMFIYLFISVILILVVNKYLLKKGFLISDTGDRHQKLASDSKVPLTGGIFLFLGYLYFLNDKVLSFILFSLIVLILGIFSDLKFLKSAIIRFLLQIFLVLIFIIFNDVQILDTRIFLLDIILSNSIANYIFVSFCILIVINGSNFIDGMNTLAIGYYLLIGIVIMYLGLDQNIVLNKLSIFYFIIFIINHFYIKFNKQSILRRLWLLFTWFYFFDFFNKYL